MFRQLGIRTMRCCTFGWVLTLLLCASATAPAGHVVYEVREPLGCNAAKWSIAWRYYHERELLSYPFTAPKGACHPGSVRLAGWDGEVPVQLADIETWGDTPFVKSATVYFVVGRPVYVRSNLRDETLGQMLIRAGALTREQHQQVLATMDEHQLQYGVAVVRLEFLTDREVIKQLAHQTRSKLESCLPWRTGSWEYVDDPTVASTVPRYTVDPVDLVFKGLARRLVLEEALPGITAEAEKYRLSLLYRGEALRPRFEVYHGTQVLEAIDQGASLAEILRAVELGAAVEQIHVLLECGLARKVRRKHPSAAYPVSEEDVMNLETLAAMDTGPRRPVTVSTPQRAGAQGDDGGPPDTDEVVAVGAGAAAEAQRLIGITYLSIYGRSYYDVLDVSQDSPAEVIEVAYHVKCKQFDVQRFRETDLGMEHDYLVEIQDRLDTAFRVLSDPEQRQEYDEQLRASHASSETRSPRLAEKAYDTGEYLAAQGKHAEASRAFVEAQEHDRQPEYRAMEAWAMFKAAGETPEAAKEMLSAVRKLLTSAPDIATIRVVAAWLCRATGELDEAIEHYQAALNLDPTMRQAFDEMEGLLLAAGELDLLEEQYRRTLFLLRDSRSPWIGELWKRLTLLYDRQLNDQDKARTALMVARDKNPEDESLELELFPESGTEDD